MPNIKPRWIGNLRHLSRESVWKRIYIYIYTIRSAIAFHPSIVASRHLFNFTSWDSRREHPTSSYAAKEFALSVFVPELAISVSAVQITISRSVHVHKVSDEWKYAMPPFTNFNQPCTIPFRRSKSISLKVHPRRRTLAANHASCLVCIVRQRLANVTGGSMYLLLWENVRFFISMVFQRGHRRPPIF